MCGTFRESMQFFDSGPTNRMTSRQKLQQITACHVEIVFPGQNRHRCPSASSSLWDVHIKCSQEASLDVGSRHCHVPVVVIHANFVWVFFWLCMSAHLHLNSLTLWLGIWSLWETLSPMHSVVGLLQGSMSALRWHCYHQYRRSILGIILPSSDQLEIGYPHHRGTRGPCQTQICCHHYHHLCQSPMTHDSGYGQTILIGQTTNERNAWI